MSIRFYLVLLLVIPLVLFCGCVGEEPEEKEPPRVLKLKVEDAPQDLEEGVKYSLTDAIILITQVDSDPIDWSDYQVYIRFYDDSIRYGLVIYSINGKVIDTSSSPTTEEEDEIIFRLGEDAPFVSEDYVAVLITDDEGSRIWSSSGAIRIY